MSEADAINALKEAHRKFQQSGDRRHLADAIQKCRAAEMTDAAIAAEIGESVEWVGEHDTWPE